MERDLQTNGSRRTGVGLGKRTLVGFVTVLATVAFVACGDDDGDGDGGGAANESAASSPVVEEAVAAVKDATGPTTKWFGPTDGPKVATNQSVVCIMYQGTDITSAEWCRGVEEAAETLGWSSSTLDGKGSPEAQRSALEQAIAQKPDGIVLASVDAEAQKGPIAEAGRQDIVVVGMHTVAEPGSFPDQGIFANITYDGQAQGERSADYAIADSNGKAKMIILTDEQFAIARLKAGAVRDRIEQCEGCELLKYENTPVAEAPQRVGGLMNSYLQQYPDEFYVYAVTDFYFDQAAAALRTAGVPEDGRVVLLGSDGSPAAYERIKNGQWEEGTIPEPARMQGWQAVDELNRAFAGEEWSGFTQPVHIITEDNIGVDLANGKYYEPKNDYRERYQKIWGVN